ncbi:MAG TPA: hypothetical protein VGG20_28565, partial [Thermoanaerobaculia bacterium]
MTHRGRRTLGALVLLVFAGLSPVRAATDVERLTHLAKLWGTVRYLHPYLAYKEIDWDAALIQAIPRVRAARSTTEYADAVQAMLSALDDPVTRVLPERVLPAQAKRETSGLFRTLDDGTLAIHLRPDLGGDEKELDAAFKALAAALPAARSVLVDIRGNGSRGSAWCPTSRSRRRSRGSATAGTRCWSAPFASSRRSWRTDRRPPARTLTPGPSPFPSRPPSQGEGKPPTPHDQGFSLYFSPSSPGEGGSATAGGRAPASTSLAMAAAMSEFMGTSGESYSAGRSLVAILPCRAEGPGLFSPGQRPGYRASNRIRCGL